jgi:phosphotransferase system enzyme I (PtsP)
MTEAVLSHESSLLLTLEEISQLVAHSHDPGETLNNIVRLIQGRFHTGVCSVYVLEPERGELVLAATVGLNPENVGRVRMHLSEGLTGLVAERMAPVTVDDAFKHPRFKYFPDLGEDLYHSFLGVPLIEGGTLEGVLVVQTVEPRSFSHNDVRMLVTVASQLAPLISEAQLLEQVIAATHEAPTAPSQPEARIPVMLRGVSLSPGVGYGQAYAADGFDEWKQSAGQRGADPAHEKRRLGLALEAARDEITQLSQRISALVGEDHGAILQAQLMIMQDRAIERDLTVCLENGLTAEAALIQTLDKYVAAFQKLTKAFFQERVTDVKDVFRRILWQLQPQSPAAGTISGRVVLLAREASVMDLFSVDLERLAAVVVEHGGPQSHAAILARSLGVPMVSQVPEFVTQLRAGRQLLVNATTGTVYVDPSSDVLASQPVKAPSLPAAALAEAAEQTGLPHIEVNINLLCEVGPALAQRARGVGLFRSEFLFLARRTLPTEEEQFGVYRKLLTALGGRPASIRTFDLRPDKLAHYSYLSSTTSSALDWRLVLDSPPLQTLFKDQVRAILRASAHGPGRILVPLVTRSEHLSFILETLDEARRELTSEGLEFGEKVPLGVMIEVPAAVHMIEQWARYVDFFALGTNDLIAAALGIDREDPVGSTRDDPLHPGFLRLIHHVVKNAHGASRPVTVCGEMAADPEGALALAALQVDGLSVPVNQLAPSRQTFAGSHPEALGSLVGPLLEARSGKEARELLQSGRLA